MLQPTQRKMSQQQKKILQREPLVMTHRQQTIPEQLKIKATTDNDSQTTNDARTAENIKATTDVDLQATDDAKTVENEGND